jgi:protein TIF31
MFEDPKQEASSKLDEIGEFLNPLHGINPQGTRDWNEEYQVVKDFPKDNIIQRAQRDRAYHKIYNDFCEAAVKGVKAIIKGSITAINPNEAEKAQVFVFNSIFFSHLVDQMEDFKDSSGTENTPSWTQGNHDLTGLKSLQMTEIDGLYFIATAIV